MTREELIQTKMQQVKEGQKPDFIGLSLSQDQLDELVPYVKDRQYIENVLLTRGWSLQYHS